MSATPAMRPLSFFAVLLGLLLLAWAAVAGGNASATPKIFAEGLTYEQASDRSTKEGKPIFAVFSAAWCGPCRAYKKGALSDPRVEKVIRDNYVPAYIDIDEQRAAARQFQVSSIPVTAVIKDGKRVQGAIGLLEADELLRFLDEVAGKLGRK